MKILEYNFTLSLYSSLDGSVADSVIRFRNPCTIDIQNTDSLLNMYISNDFAFDIFTNCYNGHFLMKALQLLRMQKLLDKYSTSI